MGQPPMSTSDHMTVTDGGADSRGRTGPLCPKCGRRLSEVRIGRCYLLSRVPFALSLSCIALVLDSAFDLTFPRAFRRHYPASLISIIAAIPIRFAIAYWVWPFLIHARHAKRGEIHWLKAAALGFVGGLWIMADDSLELLLDALLA